jgi:hypothetical protein
MHGKKRTLPACASQVQLDACEMGARTRAGQPFSSPVSVFLCPSICPCLPLCLSLLNLLSIHAHSSVRTCPAQIPIGFTIGIHPSLDQVWSEVEGANGGVVMTYTNGDMCTDAKGVTAKAVVMVCQFSSSPPALIRIEM